MFKRAKIVRRVNWLLKFSTVFGRQDVARPAESRRQLRTAKEADHATLPLMTDRGQEPRKIGRIAPSALFEAQLELHQRSLKATISTIKPHRRVCHRSKAKCWLAVERNIASKKQLFQ